jgi:NADH-quinone oxidoreductase subunit C
MTADSPETPETPGGAEAAQATAAAEAPVLPPALALVADVLGPEVEVVEQYERILATVPPERWVQALTAARDGLGADFLDWLTAVDELEQGYLVAAFVVATEDRGPGRLGKARGVILRTRIAKDAAQGGTLASAVGVYRGAAWHEREAFEMFGIEFTGHEGLAPLLLPDGFEGHPLRKDFVLASRVAKAWPGAKEPGESEHTAASPGRRRMLPPGVPGEGWLKPHTPDAPDTPGGGEDDAAAGPGDRT